MADKTDCEYLTLPLHSPVVVGACPLTMGPESLRQMIACGAGAVVLPSIFQEQIAVTDQFSGDRPSPASSDLELDQQIYNAGPDKYLTVIQETKRLASVPVIASMNGYCDGAWLDFARRIEASGADALELNVQPVIADPRESAEEIETKLVELVRKVCASVAIPVAVKTTRNFTNLANLVLRIQSAGAAGVVLFAHEVRWDVAINKLQWTAQWELTPIDSLGATVSGLIQTRVVGLDLSIAASGGVRTAEDAIKVMIAGADVVMITSEIYRAGPDAISGIVNGIERYLEISGYPTFAHFREARPTPVLRSHGAVRGDYLAPLTRSADYRDPTPVVPMQTGDQYGHQD